MSRSLVDPEKVALALREVAEIEIMPRFRKLEACDIREKGPGNFVTLADEAAERHLTERLSALLPGSTVVGEESVAADPKVLERLAAEPWIWIIDPIDGTANFCEGIETFAVMVALVRDGETVGGWIYDPVHREMIVAEKGGGAWLDGKRVAVAAPVSRPLGMTGALSRRDVPDQARRDALRGEHGFLFHGDPGDFRCAGKEYKELARGGRHFVSFRSLMPWDHAPGILIHGEAGGFSATTDDGKPYSLHRHSGPLLATPDRDSWEALRHLLYGE